MLHYQKLKSDSEEHLEQVRVFHLPSLYAVLKGQSQSVGARFYTEAYFSLFLSFERALSITCSVKPICSKTPPRYGINIRTWISQHLFRTKYQYCFFVFIHIPTEFKISQRPHYEVLFKSCSQWTYAASLLLGWSSAVVGITYYMPWIWLWA